MKAFIENAIKRDDLSQEKFIVHDTKHKITKISKLYRRSKVVRCLTDRFYNKIILVNRMCNKFLKIINRKRR